MGDLLNHTLFEEGWEDLTKYPTVSEFHAVIGLLVIVTLLGTPANSVVLYLYGRRGERFTYTIGIMASLGIDLFVCCIFVPFNTIVEALNNNMASDFFCKLFHFLFYSIIPMPLFILAVLSIDRCLCVCHTHLHATKLRWVKVAVVTMVLLAFCLGIIPSVASGVYVDNDGFGVNASSSGEIVFVGLCQFNELSLSILDLWRFEEGLLFILTITIVATFLIYGATLFVVLYRRYFGKSDLVLATAGHNPETTESVEITGTVSSLPDDRGNPDLGEERVLALIQQEQQKITLMLFIVTLVKVLLTVPTLLMASLTVPFNLIMADFRYVSFLISPFVFFCMDLPLRNEAKDLSRTTWSRMTG